MEAEIQRLRWQWQTPTPPINETGCGLNANSVAVSSLEDVLGATASTLDTFDRMQLQVVVAVCLRHASISDAGRCLTCHANSAA